MQRPRPLRGLLSEEVEVLRRLDAHGVDGRTAATAASVWGAGAAARIEADPYALALLEVRGAKPVARSCSMVIAGPKGACKNSRLSVSSAHHAAWFP